MLCFSKDLLNVFFAGLKNKVPTICLYSHVQVYVDIHVLFQAFRCCFAIHRVVFKMAAGRCHAGAFTHLGIVGGCLDLLPFCIAKWLMVWGRLTSLRGIHGKDQDVYSTGWALWSGRGRSWITGLAEISRLGPNSEPRGNNRSFPETRERARVPVKKIGSLA